jgi:acyl-ACP thioesterase
VLRRTRIKVSRWPRFGERFEVATFCSGLGRMWAERRTSVRRLDCERSDVEAVALWVHLDPQSWRPAPLTGRELEVYGPSAGDRRVSARLRHPHPRYGGASSDRGTRGAGAAGSDRPSTTWTFRTTELDVASHVNNSAYWLPLERELLEGPQPVAIDAEIEFRTPAQPGKKVVIGDGGPLRSGAMRWIVDAGGETHASVLLAAFSLQ